MAFLTQLPPEIVHAILSSCSPDDLVSLGRVNRWVRDFVHDNNALCRSVYCSYFDEPPTKDLDWVREMRDFLRLKSICASPNPEKRSELPFVHATVKRILGHSAPTQPDSADTLFTPRTFRNAEILAELLSSESNERAFLCRSFLFENGRDWRMRLRLPQAPVEEYQMSAELHSLYGTMIRIYQDDSVDFDTYPHAASKVYDIRSYTRNTGWGPFMADGSGRGDWEKIEAILIVLRHNALAKKLMKFPVISGIWNNSFGGVWPQSYRPIRRDASITPQEMEPLDLQDPYNVTGTWMRIICFLDYRDFFHFNFPDESALPADRPRRPLNEEEEARLVIMKLHVTKIDPPDEKDHPDYPIVHFEGISHSMDNLWDDNANSNLRGTCRMTKYGEVHWTTFSIIEGQERWRSESLQLGGLRSGRGVVGNWFDANYELQGPCGPTAFWKLHEKEPMKGGDSRLETFPYFLAGPTSIDFSIVISIDNHHFAVANNFEDEDEDEDEEEEEEEEEEEDGSEDEEKDEEYQDEGEGEDDTD